MNEKEKWVCSQKKKTAEKTNNEEEESVLGEFNTHRTYFRQEKQLKTEQTL